LSSDAGSGIGSDTGGDFGGDIASDDGAGLSGDMEADSSADMGADPGEDLNGNAGGDIDDGVDADTSMDDGIGSDLNADDGNDENISDDGGISAYVGDDNIDGGSVDTDNDLGSDTVEEPANDTGDVNTDEPTDSMSDEATDELADSMSDEASDIQELRSEYYDDLKNRSEYPDTIVDNGNDWSRRDAVENAEMRDEFDDSKGDLIRQWEDENGVKWPTYDEDIYTDSGNKIRGVGNRYDAHHIQPLTYGGENTASNITPLHALEHFDKKGVHASDSPFGRMGIE
jgi:hypothetical protein